jgi:hypothetical protein
LPLFLPRAMRSKPHFPSYRSGWADLNRRPHGAELIIMA